MVPSPEVLRVVLRVGEAALSLDSVELRVSAEAVDLDEQGRWVSTSIVDYGVLATLGLGRELQVLLRVKASMIGLGAPDDDEPDVVVKALLPGTSKHQPVTVAKHRVGTAKGRLSVAIEGQLASGERLSLELDGQPTLVSVKVMTSQGLEAAEALLAQTWPHRSEGVFEQFLNDELFTLWWQPRAVAEALQRERRAETEARAQAQARAKLEAIATARASRGPLLTPTEHEPLFAEGRLHAVESAELSIRPHRSGVVLELEVRVDSHSGEDGALAPTFRALVKSFVMPEVGQSLTLDLEAGSVEGAFGNDAPELIDHSFSIRRVSETECQVDWSASYDDWQTARPERLRFLGRVRPVQPGH